MLPQTTSRRAGMFLLYQALFRLQICEQMRCCWGISPKFRGSLLCSHSNWNRMQRHFPNKLWSCNSEQLGWAAKDKNAKRSLWKFIHPCHSSIHPTNSYEASSMCWGFSGKDRKDLCPDGALRLLWLRETLKEQFMSVRKAEAQDALSDNKSHVFGNFLKIYPP